MNAEELYLSIPDFGDEEYYDLSEYISALEILKQYIQVHSPDFEIGIVVTMDELGNWSMSDIEEGDEISVTYDFARYYSRDEEINPDLQFPQGTVHYHPYRDTEFNFLPSLGDVFNSASRANETGGEFGCGIIDHKGRMTIAIVLATTYDDEGFEKFIRRYNDATDENNREAIIQIEIDGIKYLRDTGLIRIYRMS